MAWLGRSMAAAHARKQGGTLLPIDSDGWCLIACVARAAPELRRDQAALLAQALEVVRDALPAP
jgi:hypothetical protein